MSKRIQTMLFTTVLLIVTAIAVAPPANAVTANVTIVANASKDGTHSLSYGATATSAGTIKYVDVTIPNGTGGSITSPNGTVRTVANNVLRWTPSVAYKGYVGTRFNFTMYGFKLPTTAGLGGPWTLTYKAVSTTGSTLSYGKGVTATATVTATNPIPGQKTTLTYKTKVTKAGKLGSIRLYIPPNSWGSLSSSSGTLSGSGAYITWKPNAAFSVGVGYSLTIPMYNLGLSPFGGTYILPMIAYGTDGSVLANASGRLVLIAPPADMPAVPVTDIVAPPAPCPNKWPSVKTENDLPGTEDWVISPTQTTTTTPAAYLTEVSATCGDTVNLKVSSGKPVSVVAYRMGYYDKLGAREIWRQDNVPTVVQPAPTIGGTADGHNLYMVSAENWSNTLAINIDQNWVPGTYLIRVDDGTKATYAPLTVRDDTGTKHALLLQQATTTWSAYNSWGGRSWYSTDNASGRLSYNRPYLEGQGSGQFLPLEQGMVFWLESQGFDVTYWTDNDLDEFGGQVQLRAKNLMLPAHDEYYSPTMRASVSQAIKSGVNVASMGANTAYREIEFTTSDRRTWDGDHWTTPNALWRDRGDGYASQPLLGAEYACALDGSTLKTGSSWLFNGITPGTSIPGFIAGEMDNLDPALYQHPGIQALSSGTGLCRGTKGNLPMTITAFTAPSGARVFNGSTFTFGCFLNQRCPSNYTVPTPSNTSQQLVQTMVKNMLDWLDPSGLQMATETTLAPDAEAKAPEAPVTVDPGLQ